MTDADEAKFVDWVRSRLSEQGRGAQSALARFLDVDRSQITELIKGRRQRLTIAERSKIVAFFAHQTTPPPELHSPGKIGGVAVAGRVGNHWEEDCPTAHDIRQIGSPILDYPMEEQLAYELLASSRDGEFRTGDFVYTVPFENYRKSPLFGDEVIVSRRKNGLTNYALQRAHRGGAGIILRSVLEGVGDEDPQAEAQIVGLVIGSFRPRLRRT